VDGSICGGQGRSIGSSNDRCHPPQGEQDRGKPAQKGALSRCLGRTKGGLNSKLHAVVDGEGKPLILLLTEGQMSDHKGARMMLEALPAASVLIGDRGYDSNWLRAALAEKGIEPCIPSTKSRKPSSFGFEPQGSSS
jgi:hypothetical protein